MGITVVNVYAVPCARGGVIPCRIRICQGLTRSLTLLSSNLLDGLR